MAVGFMAVGLVPPAVVVQTAASPAPVGERLEGAQGPCGEARDYARCEEMAPGPSILGAHGCGELYTHRPGQWGSSPPPGTRWPLVAREAGETLAVEFLVAERALLHPRAL